MGAGLFADVRASVEGGPFSENAARTAIIAARKGSRVQGVEARKPVIWRDTSVRGAPVRIDLLEIWLRFNTG